MISQQILLKHSEPIAWKYYSIYRNYFTQISFDAFDVQQEAKIVVLEIMSKYPTKNIEELKKLCNQAIGWKFNILLRDVLKEPEMVEFNETYHHKTTINHSNMFFHMIEELCTDEEYDILEMKFKDNMTDEEIAEVLNEDRKVEKSPLLRGQAGCQRTQSKQQVWKVLSDLYKKLNREIKKRDF